MVEKVLIIATDEERASLESLIKYLSSNIQVDFQQYSTHRHPDSKLRKPEEYKAVIISQEFAEYLSDQALIGEIH